MKVLIIEDSPSISNAFLRILSNEGYEVSVAQTASLALSKLEENYDLLLVDLMLPGMDGAELIKRVREAGSDSTIVITTNMGSGYDKDALLKMGVKEIVLKAKLGPGELRDLVAKYA